MSNILAIQAHISEGCEAFGALFDNASGLMPSSRTCNSSHSADIVWSHHTFMVRYSPNEPRGHPESRSVQIGVGAHRSLLG